MSSSAEASAGMMLVLLEPISTVGEMVLRSSAFRSGSARSQARPSLRPERGAGSASQPRPRPVSPAPGP